jgi:hypothetical protein
VAFGAQVGAAAVRLPQVGYLPVAEASSKDGSASHSRRSIETPQLSRGRAKLAPQAGAPCRWLTESPPRRGRGWRAARWGAPPSPSMLKHLRDAVLLFSMIAERMP